MPVEFISHLEELRSRLLSVLFVFFAAAIASYFFSKDLLEILISPIRTQADAELVFYKPYEAFAAHLKVSALVGIIVASPVFFTQGWLFVAPGLYRHEKKSIFPLALVSVALFLLGALFAYYVVVPWGLHFLLAFQTDSLKPMIGVGHYFSFLMGMVLAFGFLFDFPVFMVGAVKMGLLSPEALAKARRSIVVVIFILAAVLTPSPDPFSQLLLALPLWILYEISLGIARWMGKKGPKSGQLP